MTRQESFAALAEGFDVLVIGGGATGLGIAVDAVTRGLRTALVEAGDFAQATSSRATKLVHGGVRYLASGQISLVYEALHERAVMQRIAPNLVHPQPFLLPAYTPLELPYYAAGLMLYDRISGKATMGPTRVLGRRAALASIPNLRTSRLSGGILYHDGQFNDARLALALARTCADHGGVVLNYARCTRLLAADGSSDGRLGGAAVVDQETGGEFTVRAKVIFNAAGIFVDEVRQLDDERTPPLLTHSRGTHIVVAASALGGATGIMVPKTPDGRVIFAIPWQGRVVIGTTDLAAPGAAMEPGHTPDEIAYLLETINPYLARPLGQGDILSIFSGLRPLVTGSATSTSKISREHRIDVSPRGLITVAGGKWTTYRRMAQDALEFAIRHQMLPPSACVTATTPLHGADHAASAQDPYLAEYGADIGIIQGLMAREPQLAQTIDPALPYTFAEVVFAVRYELARTLEDVLSRRTRALLLDAAATLRAAPAVAERMARELGRDAAWTERQLARFQQVAERGSLPREVSVS
jgi:glycerol-3-phosphate dehydrogenase